MILALSSGISAYIDDVQEDTLSSVPLSIKKYTGDTAAIFEAMTQTNADADFVYEDDRIYPNDTMGSMFSCHDADSGAGHCILQELFYRKL